MKDWETLEKLAKVKRDLEEIEARTYDVMRRLRDVVVKLEEPAGLAPDDPDPFFGAELNE